MDIDSDLLLERQDALELKGSEDGISRFKLRLTQSAFSDSKVGLNVLTKGVSAFSQALQDYLSQNLRVTRPNGPSATLRDILRETLELSHPDELSFCLTKGLIDVVFSSVSKDCLESELKWGNYRRLCKLMSDTLNRHHNFCLYRNSPDWGDTERHLKTRSKSQVHRERALSAAMQKSTVRYRELSEEHRVTLGMILVHLFVESTGLCYVTIPPECPKTYKNPQQHILPHPEVLQHCLKLNHRLEGMEPVCYPMLIPALPWESSSCGGYMRNAGLPHEVNTRFIKGSKGHNAIAEINGDFPRVARVADILGGTAFRINRRVLSVLKELQARGEFGKIIAPSKDDLSLPVKPWTTQEEYLKALKDTPGVVKEWKRKAAREYDRVLGSEALSKRVKVNRQIQMSEVMLKEPKIYFPHNVDFRGRYYPMTPFVNPQSDDTGVSLLEFARGVEITDENLEWYLIHGANLWGKDKVPFEDRVSFVSSPEFTRDVISLAEDPIANASLWVNTDSPMMFLSWALEYADVLTGKSKVTHQPISVDGTCNGIQHYSALLRDSVGAAAVNLRNSEKPADVYSDVARETIRILRERESLGDLDAPFWIPLVSRKVVKRNIMTTPYGVTKFGMKEQLNKELKDIEGMPQDYKRHTLYLSRVIYEAMGTCIESAQRGMAWLQMVAKSYLGEGLSVSWVTPLGLHCTQEYQMFQTRTLQMRQGSFKLNITSLENTNEPNRRKNVSAFSPNFIHSLDASHLGFTVLAMHDLGGARDFSMVHDSYGTSLDHVPMMNKVLREQFVRLYTEFNPLESLRTSFRDRCSKELPAVPTMGTFDLTEVLQSKYFFM